MPTPNIIAQTYGGSLTLAAEPCVGQYGGSLTLAAPLRTTAADGVSAVSENAPRIFAAAEWRRLAGARRRHKTQLRINAVPTPYQRRVQRAMCIHE